MPRLLEWISQTWSLMSLVSQILLILWVLGMIAVPIVAWVGGKGTERIGITVTVLLQVGLVISILHKAWGTGRTAAAWLAVSGIGWASEVIGSRSGFPYGAYHYTRVLKPQILDVPVIVPLAWMMMMPPAWAVGHVAAAGYIGPGASIMFVLLSALAFTSWDLYLDPLMVRWGFWKWHRNGAYFGIPLSNYMGWFCTAGVITAIVGPSALPAPPLLLVFFITWLLQAVGQMVFWGLIGPGIAGFIGMGIMAAAAWKGIPW
ncbi:MAG: carotenoid biosynthesis protein [Spirochaeta sp.]